MRTPCASIAPRTLPSRTPTCANLHRDAECLKFTPLADLCGVCFRKQHLEVAPSSYGGLGAFVIDFEDKDIKAGDVICQYVTNSESNHLSSAWHKKKGKTVMHHALTFTDKDGKLMVSDAESLTSGVGGRVNVSDASNISNC